MEYFNKIAESGQQFPGEEMERGRGGCGGIAMDGVAAAIPVVSGGLGASIAAYRALEGTAWGGSVSQTKSYPSLLHKMHIKVVPLLDML